MNGVKIHDSVVACNSLARYSIQKINDEIKITTYSDSIQLSDQIHVFENKIQFLGRADDKIQILSETVSLSELRSILENVLIESGLPIDDYVLIAYPNQRSENQLALVSIVESSEIIQKFNSIVRPYERISRHFLVKKIPITDLGKVKYQELETLYPLFGRNK